MEEITTEVESNEEETTGSKCPHCSEIYTTPKKCEHLLCEVYYAESNNELIAAPNSPIVATLFGIEVPKTVAMRFMRFLRERSPPSGLPGVEPQRISTIKYSIESGDCFREWTYFLAQRPWDFCKLFESFVHKTYCDTSLPRSLVPFSQLRIDTSVMILEVDPPSSPNIPLRWIMLSNLPDDLPAFLFPVQNNDRIMYINHGDSMQKRMGDWSSIPETCTANQLVTLPTFLVN